jgi:enoyl-[acyl-carrier-protein] reductase (NADH)
VAELLEGTNGLVDGVANKRSIAWAIARKLDQAGQRLVLT